MFSNSSSVRHFNKSLLFTFPLLRKILTCRCQGVVQPNDAILFQTFLVIFLSGFPFTNIHDSQNSMERGGYPLNSSLPLPPTSETLRHQPGNYCRELTSTHSQHSELDQEHLVSECKSLTIKLRALNFAAITRAKL